MCFRGELGGQRRAVPRRQCRGERRGARLRRTGGGGGDAHTPGLSAQPGSSETSSGSTRAGTVPPGRPASRRARLPGNLCGGVGGRPKPNHTTPNQHPPARSGREIRVSQEAGRPGITACLPRIQAPPGRCGPVAPSSALPAAGRGLGWPGAAGPPPSAAVRRAWTRVGAGGGLPPRCQHQAPEHLPRVLRVS